MLSLPEELLLLSIDDDKGKITGSMMGLVGFGLAGAVLADLALKGKIQLDDKEKLALLDPTPVGSPVLDAVLEKMAAADRVHKATYWVNILTGKKLQKALFAQLVEKKVLMEQERRYLWVIPYTEYTEQDASAKFGLKQRLRSLVLAGGEIGAHDLALLSLMRACRFLNLLFTKDERKAASKKVAELVKNEVFGQAVSKTIAEIEEAAALAAMDASMV